MSPRKSSNPNSRSFHTYEEFKRFKHGTITDRLGKDSIKDFDSCSLCLDKAQSPMLVCHQGHLFCKLCIFEYLLSQKQQLKVDLERYEIQKKIQLENQNIKKQEKTVVITKFNNLNKGIIDDNNDLKKEKEKVPSFWIPSQTPEGIDTKLTEPRPYVICPEGDPHRINRKDLLTIHFEIEKNESDKESENQKHQKRKLINTIYICGTCRKPLTNASRPFVLVDCGHVVCLECAKLSGAEINDVNLDSKMIKTCDKSKLNICVQCGTEIKSFISLQVGGTGFIAHGAQISASKIFPVGINNRVHGGQSWGGS